MIEAHNSIFNYDLISLCETSLRESIEIPDSLLNEYIVSEIVSSKLEKEIDRLNQYHRRSNIVVRNVFLPEKEINKDLDNEIITMISKDLNLLNVFPDIDKLHHIGKIKERNGKFLFAFNSIANLNELLREMGMDEDLN